MLQVRTAVVTSRVLRCPVTGRPVRVELLMVGLPGLRRAQDVLACSAFESETAITCDRRCVRPVPPARWVSDRAP